MSVPPKRFYTSVAHVEGMTGWEIHLDGRRVRTPGQLSLSVPTELLAKAIATEWRGQGEVIRPVDMHLTRLANVSLDLTPSTRSGLADEVASYCGTDLTCYLADAPKALRERQEAAWGPLRSWAGEALGVVLSIAEGVMPYEQPSGSIAAARDHAETLDDFRLTGLTSACGLFGSALLALAVERGHMAAGEAFEASVIDALYQEERWGRDDEAAALRAAQRREAEAVGTWFRALQGSD